MDPEAAPARTPPLPPRPPAPPTTGDGASPPGGRPRRRAASRQKQSGWSWFVTALGELRMVNWPQPTSAAHNSFVAAAVIVAMVVVVLLVDVVAQLVLPALR